MTDETEGPVLTLPPEEAEAVRAAYGTARVILEYGSGGSTQIAAQNAGAVVFSVESDAEWLAKMGRWFTANPASADLRLHHADIGPTKAWGMPADNKMVKKWAGYPNSVWERADFSSPDVVLIDGRFRLACFLTVLLRTTRPVTLLWDDYLNRSGYHEAERLAKPVQMIGRMARFQLEPARLDPKDLGWITAAYLRPN